MPDTAGRYRTNTGELIPDTLAVLGAIRELQESARLLAGQAEALHREWADARAQGHLCDWGQDPPDTPLDVELLEWVERLRPLATSEPASAPPRSPTEAVSRAAETDLGPAYFFG